MMLTIPFPTFKPGRLAAAGLVLLLGGCASLPSQGPSAIDIALQETPEESITSDFVVVPLNEATVQALGPDRIGGVSSALRGGGSGRPNARAAVGDQLRITIWEPSEDGLFSSVARKETEISATVDEDGDVFVPYGGRIDVAGKSAEEIRTAITSSLEGQAVNPQVQVAIASNGGNQMTVIGDVSQPGRVEVPPSGIRLLDAIALVGGARESSFESEVKIVRGSQSVTVDLDHITGSAGNNIWMQPRDTLEVLHRPRSFTAFGAVSSKNLQQLQTEDLTLAEALAQSGGLNENLADAGGVFLFRFEPIERLRAAGIDTSTAAGPGKVPTIYRLDFTEPQAFFRASSFALQDKDILYVATAPAAEFRLFVTTILSPFLGSATNAQAVTN